MIKFLFEIPVTMKRADGQSMIVSMGSYAELKTSVRLEIEATDAKEAGEKLKAAFVSMLSWHGTQPKQETPT